MHSGRSVEGSVPTLDSFKRHIPVIKVVSHSARVLKIAQRFGWLPGARYTNLRDLRRFERVGFIDIVWSDYCFRRHLEAVRATRPLMTVARDIEDMRHLARTLDQAEELALHCSRVIVVPKSARLSKEMNDLIPKHFILGYSVPSRYGGTKIPPKAFKRPVHLLGGRPDTQRHLAGLMPVSSIDCNRFTYDAAFGDYFDGETFRPHRKGGYERCIRDSLRNINALWRDYPSQRTQDDRSS